ncbi:MAG: T9SS type A sorting domain-containing protein [Bacteroidota bacterium]
MKKAVLLFLSLYVGLSSLNAQNWQILNPDYRYHYVSDGNLQDSLSAKTLYRQKNLVDTAFLNTQLFYPEPNDRRLIQLAAPQFLNKRMRNQGNGKKYFHQPGAFVLFEENAPSSWLYDSLHMIVANIDKIYEEEIYGISDSIRRILLSNGDTILQAKSLGLLQFPSADSQFNYHKQIGITGPNLGFYFPQREEFYAYEIGDKIERLDSRIISTPGSGTQASRAKTWDKTIQFEVLDTDIGPTGEAIYRIQEYIMEKYEEVLFPRDIYGVVDSSLTFRQAERWVNLDYLDAMPGWSVAGSVSSRDLWEISPGEVYPRPQSFPNMKFLWFQSPSYEWVVACDNYLERSFSSYPFDHPANDCQYYEFDGPNRENLEFYCYPSSQPFAVRWEIKWLKGVGLRFLEFSEVKTDYTENRQTISTTAWEKSGKKCGSFTPYEVISGENLNPDPDPLEGETEHAYLSPFVNPAQEIFHVSPKDDDEEIQLRLIDLSGRLVMDKRVMGNKAQEVRVPDDLLSGIYVLFIVNAAGATETYYKVLIN